MRSASFALLKIISKILLSLEFLLAALCLKPSKGTGMGLFPGLLLLLDFFIFIFLLVLWAGELSLHSYVSACLKEPPAPTPLA